MIMTRPFIIDSPSTITDEATAFPAGTVLTDRTAYFQAASPQLNGSFSYVYDASERSDVATEITITLQTRSVSTDTDRNTTVYWQTNQTLNQTRGESVTPNERVTSSFSTNVTAALAEARRTDEELGGTPGPIQVAILARVDVSGVRNGQQVETGQTYRLPIIPGDGVYRVNDPGVVTTSGSQTEQVTVQTEPSLWHRLGGLSLVVSGMCLALGLLYGRYADVFSLSQGEHKWLEYRVSRQEHDDWITAGQITKSRPTEVVTIDSLEGLVDVAIDTNSRVIEEPATGRYIVADGELLYQYRRPPNPYTESAVAPEHQEDGTQAVEEADGASTEPLPANDADTQPEE